MLRNLAAPQRRKNPAIVSILEEVFRALTQLSLPAHRAQAETTLVRLHTERRGLSGVSLIDLQRSLPLGLVAIQRAVNGMTKCGHAVRLDGIPENEDGAWLSASALNQVSQAIVDAVTAVQRKDVHSQGLAKETLQAQLTGPLRRLSVRTVEAVWLRLVQEGKLVAEREFLRLPGVATISVDSPQVSAVLSAFLKSGLSAPRLEDLPTLLTQQTPMTPAPRSEDLKKLVEQLTRRGDLVRLKDLIFHRDAIADLRTKLVAFLTQHREISPSQFKELVGQSRKYSIPLAEYFDAQRVTLRVGDQRRLRG